MLIKFWCNNLGLTIIDGQRRRLLLCQALVAWPRLRQWEEGDGCDRAMLEDVDMQKVERREDLRFYEIFV